MLFKSFWNKCFSLKGQWLEIWSLPLWALRWLLGVKSLRCHLNSLHVVIIWHILLEYEASVEVALELGQVTLVARVPKRVVEVLAPVAGPVSWSERGLGPVECLPLIWLSILVVRHIVSLVLEPLWPKLLSSCPNSFLLLKWYKHVLWLAARVLVGPVLLASVALCPPFEVVVLALAAFPPAFRERELFSHRFILIQFFLPELFS